MWSRRVGGAVALALILLARASAAEPAFDRCAYMHHLSKAYAACMSDRAAAAVASATIASTPTPSPRTETAKAEPKPKPKDRTRAGAKP